MPSENTFFEESFLGDPGHPSTVPEEAVSVTPTSQHSFILDWRSGDGIGTFSGMFKISGSKHLMTLQSMTGKWPYIKAYLEDAGQNGAMMEVLGASITRPNASTYDEPPLGRKDVISVYHNNTRVARLGYQTLEDGGGVILEDGFSGAFAAYLLGEPGYTARYYMSESYQVRFYVRYRIYYSIPYCEPPEITLTATEQTRSFDGTLNPASVSFTARGGYQFHSEYATQYQIQRRATRDGINFSEWQDVQLTNVTSAPGEQHTLLPGEIEYSYYEIWIPVAYYRSGPNEWEEYTTARAIQAVFILSDATPNYNGAYYQYRARTLSAADTPDTDWILYFVESTTDGEIVKKHWQNLSEAELTELENQGKWALCPWSDTVQCQRSMTITAPQQVSVSPQVGSHCTLSWVAPDFADASNTYQENARYYVKGSWTDSNNQSQETVVCMVEVPATSTNISVDFTDVVLQRFSALEFGTITFSVYAVYMNCTSDESSTVSFTYRAPSFGGGGGVSYYDGTNWRECIVHYYDGTNWRECIPHYYDGTQWRNLG